MKYPCLVPNSACNAEITVRLESGVGEDGAPLCVATYKGKCSYMEKSRTVLNDKKQWVALSAVAYIPGDIAPERVDISGTATVEIKGLKYTYRIHEAPRGRNPDGTVNYTRLDLMT